MKTMCNPAKHLWRVVLAMILVVSMLGAASVMCFAETTASEEATEPTGITNVGVSLGEDIIVKFATSATTADGSKLTVVFNGETIELTQNVDGVFEFVGVTPQNLGDEMTATLTDADGAQVGEAKTVSVKTYLEGLLALSYENSGCKSQLQYQAMRELCVNMLNYGAAAQTYVEHDVENLANAGLSDEQKALATEKITVTDTDKAVSGSAWVGAGVRFDYKLGLYFVFTAASADEYTATINGEAVTAEAYTALGEGYYVIRYNSFNATNMNEVVTAKLAKDGADDQTFAYSIKSYVASKGGDESAIANLVNATYVYGFAAVAYSAEYVTVDPTFEEVGSISMDGKGYDFSNSKYGTVTLPVLNFTDYTAETVNNGTELAPEVATTFTLNDDTVAYTKTFESTNYIDVNGTICSEYDMAKAESDSIDIEYSEATGYTVTGTNATLTNLMSYGADIMVKGDITINNRTEILGITFTVGDGTETGKGTVIFVEPTEGAADSSATVAVRDKSELIVSKSSSLEVRAQSGYSIYLGAGMSSPYTDVMLLVDGTLTANNKLQSTVAYQVNTDYEFGFKPAVYVREGVLNAEKLLTCTMQIGSEAENKSGTLNVSTQLTYSKNTWANRHALAKGQATIEAGYFYVRSSNAGGSQVYLGSEMKFISTGDGFIEGTEKTNNYHLFICDGFTYNGPDTFTKYKLSGSNLTLYSLKTFNVNLDGKEDTTVRIVNTEALSTATNTYAAVTDNFPALAEGVSLTSIEETVDYGLAGTFTKATYVDGDGVTQTIWYQIVD
ncbi:MAG: hypothetical protein IJ011_00375 [Clostridia bacterium]|nr:hypothetical protein [Clostridia bacterium]